MPRWSAIDENDQQQIDGVTCVKLEANIDYYRDKGAHMLMEVAVDVFGAVTDPRTEYALRWMAGQRAGIP